jgi:hypothetical protein
LHFGTVSAVNARFLLVSEAVGSCLGYFLMVFANCD